MIHRGRHDSIPRLIAGRYEILDTLGEGGMGTVFKVHHRELDGEFALKILPDHLAGDPDRVSRFRREAQKMARFRHDHIVRMYDFGRDGALFYLVLECIDGPSLRDVLRERGRLPLADALDLARQIAGALAYAHAQRVTHRDVKPSNILLERLDPLHAMLIDFGIAKVDDAGDATQSDMLVGTYRYGAPEQLGYRRGRDRVPVGPHADQWGLALVLHEMLEGRHLFADLDMVEVIARVALAREEILPEFSSEVPAAVRQLVVRALRRAPEERHPSMNDMLRALEAAFLDVVNPRAREEGIEEDLDAEIRALEAKKQRRITLAVRSRAAEERQRADEVDAPRLAPEPYRVGVQRSDDGDAALDRSEYAHARDLLAAAAEAFGESAAAAIVRLRRETAETEREAARRAREDAAVAVGEVSPPAYDRGLGLESDGDAAVARDAWEDAVRAYVEARVAYTDAARQLAAARARRDAETALDAMRRACADAESEQAPAHAAEEFAQARAQEAEAQAAFEGGAYDEARRGYVAAGERYAAAAAAALLRRRQQEAEEMRERARSARAIADQSRAQREASYPRAIERAAAGDAALAARRWVDARGSFEAARDLFGAAAREAEDHHRGEVEGLRAVAVEARTRAAAAGALDGASAVQAVEAERAAEQHLAADRYDDAERAFVECAALYDRATLEANEARRREQERQRQRADAARENATAARARAEVGGAAELAEPEWAEAERAYSEAELLIGVDDVRAADALASAGHRFDEAASAAVRRREAAARAHVPSEPSPEDVSDLSVLVRPAVPAPIVRDVTLDGRGDEPTRLRVRPREREARRLRVPAPLLAAAIAAVAAVTYVIHPLIRRPPAVAVAPAERPAPALPTPVPLAWSAVRPLGAEVPVLEGGRARFKTRARGAPSSAAPRWSVDGVERARGWSWEYRPGSADAGGVHIVTAALGSGSAGIERSWRVPVAASNHPPEIRTRSPEDPTVAVVAGAPLTLSVDAADPDAGRGDLLAFRWERNGRTIAGADAASLTVSDAADGDTFRATAVDRDGLEATAAPWRVVLLAPPRPSTEAVPPVVVASVAAPALPTKPPPRPSGPPRVVRQDPPPTRLAKLDEGGVLDFGLQAVAPDPADEVGAVWYLDGVEVGRGMRWRLVASPATEERSPHRVEAKVCDGATCAERVGWNVEVKARPPRLVEAEPRATRLTVAPGDRRRLRVVGEATAGVPLAYRWVLDGGQPRVDETGVFELPGDLRPGRHVVDVALVDRRGLETSHRWSVDAVAPEPPRKPREDNPPSASAPPVETAVAPVSDGDVRAWLDAYRQAFEVKDAERLSALGAVSVAQVERLRRQLAGYGRIEMRLEQVQIVRDGDAATVSFDRRIADETGPLPNSPRQTFHLRRTATGTVVAERAAP